MQPVPIAPILDERKKRSKVRTAFGDKGGQARQRKQRKEHNEDRENAADLLVQTSAKSADFFDGHKVQQLQRGVLLGSTPPPMTPTGLVSTTAPFSASKWLETSGERRLLHRREEEEEKAKRKMSQDSTTKALGQAAQSANLETAAPQDASSQASAAVKAEPSSQVAASTSAPAAVKTESELPDSSLAGGLVGGSSSNTAEAPAQEAAAATSSAPERPTLISALSAASTNRDSMTQQDPLRTEVMGPPPTLPSDLYYPPLNPVLTDAPVPAPAPKRRGPNTSVNGTQRKPAPAQAPADFEPPTNFNGKMPYALFQTIKRTPKAELTRSSADAQDSSKTHSEITTSDDAPSTFPQIDAHREKSATPVDSTSNNNVAIDLLLADALTDADSVATATATRETSPEGSTAPETSSHVAAPEVIAPIQPSTSRKLAATPSRTISHIILDSGSSTPIAESSPVADASPSVALRRNPSSRGASMQASQSITNAYADPLGLKKHRESLLQESARARRSPSAGSAGGSGAASATAAATSAAASAKKIATARTFVPPPLVEPPPGMMYTLEGRLRTIPGIAGALVPPGPNSTTTDTNLTPRLEDKGSSNNDFCETCGGHGRFVCCDGCPRSFHFFCMSPPLDIDEMPPSNAAQVLGPPKPNLGQKGKAKAVGGDGGASAELNMEEMWFCNVCVAERQPKAAPKPKGLGPFGFLLPVLSQQNPKSFQLPADVRTYFKDVATANDGDYVNAGMIRQVKPNKHGIIEARDPYRLKDKNGDAVLCFRCGGTALPSSSTSQGQEAAATPADPTIRDGTGWRKIISCDFCPLHWHIDCVDPPMLGMPSNLRKWMCPAHSDHVNDRRRVARIGTSVPRTIDLPIPSAKTIGPGKHFRTRVLNNGDIDIIPDPMEELMGANGISGSLQSGIKDISVIPGVVDEPSLTEGGSKMASRIRYRFPEKVIRTDFWSKLRADEATSIGSVFYVAAEEVVGRTPVRFVAREEDASLDDGRYRPFGKREYARSGLDSLADIAAARLVGDGLAKAEKNPDFIRPSRTRQLIATALGIDLQNDQVPESSIRSSLDEPQASSSAASGSSLESPLSSLSESETEPEATKGDSVAPAVAVPEPAPPALSEEELVKRIAAEAASTVNSGEPLRLTKRKAAVAAESALAGTPTPVAKKMRPASPATTTVSVEVKPAAPAAGAGGKKITIKSNGVVVRSKQKEAAEGLTESQSALRKAYFLAEQHEAERKEVEQLRAIKELMRIKGPGRLLEFLLSPNEDEPSQ